MEPFLTPAPFACPTFIAGDGEPLAAELFGQLFLRETEAEAGTF